VLATEIVRCRQQREGPIPFISLNCATLNNDVADSVIFGHRRGAFTGAHDRTQGAVGAAHGGVLFLDEIHCLSISSQRKLLRLLDDGSYTAVGESLQRHARFQFITASNQDLADLAMRGEFLFDLLMRIQGIEIALSPLRDRPEELYDLMALYFASHEVSIRQDDFQRIVAQCRGLHWPGNVRQLYKALDTMRFNALLHGDTQYAPHFVATPAMSNSLVGGARETVARVSTQSSAPQTPRADASTQRLYGLLNEIATIVEQPVCCEKLLESLESTMIEYALARHKSIKDVMAHLAMSRGQLDFKRRKYGLMEYCHTWPNRSDDTGRASHDRGGLHESP
jgi:DNA-binding NtrC family response regulator